MILDEFFKSKSTAVLAEGHGNYAGDRPVNLGGVSMKKIQIGDTVIYIDQKAQVVDMSQDREHARITIPSSSTTKTVLTSDLRPLGRGIAEDNLHGGGPDDEVKFFIDSEPAYYAVMDRFGDHIDFRGDDMVAPLRLWGAIQQTAGDAGGAADIAGLEDEPMWVGDELDEQGVAEGSEKQLLKQVKQYCRDAWVSNGTLWVECDPLQAKKLSHLLNAKPIPGSVSGEYGFDIKQGVAEGSKESYMIIRTDAEGKKDVFAGNFDTYERAQKELDDCLAHPLHTKYNQKFEIKRKGQRDVAEATLSELSPATLANYKKKAGAAATAADSAGDRKTGDRRFSGIVKATKKQFDQDAKQSAQAVHESRLRVMASIIKTQ